MTNELVGAVVGGAIGVIAALVGAVLTFWLTIRAERRKERTVRTAALTACRLEAATVASALRSVGATTLPPLVATQQIISSGMLAHVQPTTARELLLFNIVVHDLERAFVTIETLGAALVSAGEGKTANQTLRAWRDRSERLARTAAERAESAVKTLADELRQT